MYNIQTTYTLICLRTKLVQFLVVFHLLVQLVSIFSTLRGSFPLWLSSSAFTFDSKMSCMSEFMRALNNKAVFNVNTKITHAIDGCNDNYSNNKKYSNRLPANSRYFSMILCWYTRFQWCTEPEVCKQRLTVERCHESNQITCIRASIF